MSEIIVLIVAIAVLVLVLVGAPLLMIGLVVNGSRWRGARFVLSVAQFVSILGCIGSVIGPILHFRMIRESGVWADLSSVAFLLAAELVVGFLAFCFCASLFILFGRARESD